LRTILPKNNRLGVETAHSLFNSVFYYHNVKKGGGKHVPPIWSFEAKSTKDDVSIRKQNPMAEEWYDLTDYDHDNRIESCGGHNDQVDANCKFI